MGKKIVINKPRGLYGKTLIRLKDLDKGDRLIPWSSVYEKFGRGFSIKKDEVREIIFMLKDFGVLSVCPSGIKLFFDIK